MRTALIQYDYSSLLQELIADILNPMQPKIAYGKKIQVLREKETKGIYNAIIDYYLLDEDIKDSIGDDEELYQSYLEDKDKLKVMLVDDVIKEMNGDLNSLKTKIELTKNYLKSLPYIKLFKITTWHYKR